MAKIFTKEVKIALVAVTAIVCLFFGMNFLKGLSPFSDDDNYYIEFTNSEGLTGSCPIFVNGFRVGIIKDLEYDFNETGHIIAFAGIDKKLQIPEGSHAEIYSDIMGNTRINLIFNHENRNNMKAGDTMQGGMSSGAMDQAKALIPELQKMLPKLDSILYSLNHLMADPAVTATLHNAQTITDNLALTSAQLNIMMEDLNRRIPGIAEKADNVLANTQTLTSNLAAVDIAATMAKVDNTLANCEQLTNALNSREGTVGLMLHDPSLYNNLNNTVQSADSLVNDLKAHPKRYVHFSVFGKKDK